MVERAGRIAAMMVYGPERGRPVAVPIRRHRRPLRQHHRPPERRERPAAEPGPGGRGARQPGDGQAPATSRSATRSTGSRSPRSRPRSDDLNPADGEKVHLKVVGIGVYPNEVVPTAQYDSLPFVYLTPAFFKAHRDAEPGVRVRGHPAAERQGRRPRVPRRDEPAAAQARRRARNDALVSDRSEPYAQVERAIEPQTLALGVFALLAGVVFLLVVGQVLARQISLDSDEYPTLRAIGMTRHELFAAAMARVGVISVVGAVGRGRRRGAGVAADADRTGAARRAPSRVRDQRRDARRRVPRDRRALHRRRRAPGLARRAATPADARAPARRRQASRRRDDRRRRRAVADRRDRDPRRAPPGTGPNQRPGAQRPHHLGARDRRGRRRVHVHRRTSTTSRTRRGSTAGTGRLKAGNGFFPVDTRRRLMAAARPRTPTSTRSPAPTTATCASSGRTVAAVGIDSLKGSIFPTLLEGRAPRNDHEIVLGTRTLRQAGVERRRHGSTSSSATQTRYRCASSGAPSSRSSAPAASPRPTSAKARRPSRSLFADPTPPQGRRVHVHALPAEARSRHRGRPSATRQGSFGRMEFCGGEIPCVETAERPGDLSNYTRVRGTPLLLAGGARAHGHRRARPRAGHVGPPPPPRHRGAQDPRLRAPPGLGGHRVAGDDDGRGRARSSASPSGSSSAASRGAGSPTRSASPRTSPSRARRC